MNCKTFVKSSVNFLAAALMATSAFAQNAVPQYPVLKSPASTVTRDLKHAESIRVRVVLNDLNPNDYVDTLEVSAAALQSGAGLEIFVDQAKLSQVNLTNQARTYSFAVNKVNGVDYKQITIRSVGASRVSKIVARVSDPNGHDGDVDDLLPPPPPPPPGIDPLPPVGPNPPPPPPPPVVVVPSPTLPEFNQHANCTTESRGLRFSDSTEADVALKCQAYKNSFGTHPDECYANANCKSPRMTCTASADSIPLTAYTYDSIVQKCSKHPSIASKSTCMANIRCEGGQPGGPVVAPADPQFPWQTKARDSNGVLHRFFGRTKDEAIQQCLSRVGQVQQCYDAATCQNNCDGGIHIQPPPPPFPGHGGGHVGPLPPPFPGHGLACRTWSNTSFDGILTFSGITRDQVVNECIAHQKTRNDECRANVNPQCGSHLVPGPGHGHGYHGPIHGLRCTSSDGKLLDAQFNVVYDFSDLSSCEEAKNNIALGKPFCDFSNNTLRRLGGTMIYDFNNANDCRSAVDRVYMGRNFCESEYNTLRDPNGNVVYDFSSWTDCVNNLN